MYFPGLEKSWILLLGKMAEGMEKSFYNLRLSKYLVLFEKWKNVVFLIEQKTYEPKGWVFSIP